MNKRNRRGKRQTTNSKIKSHKRDGNRLIPPMAQISWSYNSWIDQRLPEMLWACLLVTHLPREYVLDIFRQVAKYIEGLPEEDKFHEVTHTGLSKLPSEHQNAVLSILVAQPEQQEVLVPLLLLDELPGREIWARALGIDSVEEDWELLMDAVSHTLWHQTQKSTDCRWLKVLCFLVAGKLKIGLETPEKSEQSVKEILYYPYHGDPSKVQASIRAKEISLIPPNQEPTEWADKFWNECLNKTPCYPLDINFSTADLSVGTTRERLGEVRNFLIEHTHKTRTTSGVDARHDTVFGMALYCLGLLQELLQVGNCSAISGRTTLRTIAECYITLGFLAHNDDTELWKKYRAYGTGQAKKVFLKLSDSIDKPNFIDLDTLEHLANEDMWQELQEINIGHWADSNLRKMSEEAGVKDDYDRFNDWTATFSHGHWPAIRDAVFDTCSNPLHRLHRIPSQSVRSLPDVVPDACQLVDKILGIVSQLYPNFQHRVTL